MNQPDQMPSPQLLFESLNAYQKSAALKAAIEIGVFTAIARGNTTPARLAQSCEADERGVRILCDYLVVNGFLTKADGSYGLTRDSAAFLDEQSPAYMGGCIEFLLAPQLTDGFADMTTVVRQGGTAIRQSGTMAPEHPVWVKFARAMAPMAAMPAQHLAKLIDGGSESIRVLDIAAGHGMYGLAFAMQNPNAHVVALDWPSVLEVAAENAGRTGVADRFTTIGGSAFDVDWSSNYDVVLLPNFLHHFDTATNEGILRRAHGALKPGGRVVIVEFVPNEDRVSPPLPAAFAFTMLGSTEKGDVYTYPEYDAMCRNAGFARTELQPLPPSPLTAVVGHKE
jgi:SAM-dependent methyltransferase